MKSYNVLKSTLLKDKEIKKAYDELGPEFVVIKKMIEQRLKQGLSQKDLAQKVGTKQSAISRFESGTYNPTINFLYKVASALDVELKVSVR